ncbi:tyrosine-type recombinase/integrase [sulfur-oxidizing endosymbiont of Gigantopelta aegis]|uniref:tyrosine-type recombinase/integrase n=1 Tax=sulfur-oxidizing endosymbiont of Gigantopelta aegis TaxID=2794934 RepID=UPI001FE7E57E|nr:site-specific integrase [sulfur-oxidizing endosymbiont of Gigantopelta aegis]
MTQDERDRFLKAASEECRENRVFCHVLHFTGCRISEALELTTSRILLPDQEIIFRTLKKRKVDQNGNPRKEQYRHIPVPAKLIDELDLVFDLRRIQKQKRYGDELLWNMSRATAWRLIKKVMEKAEITGPQATPKGFRHGFGIAMAQTGMPLTILKDLLGHASTSTTEIYLQFAGKEKREMVMKGWEKINT